MGDSLKLRADWSGSVPVTVTRRETGTRAAMVVMYVNSCTRLKP